MERFSPNNAPEGKTAIQVEVYGSVFKPLPQNPLTVQTTVVQELRMESSIIPRRLTPFIAI